MRYAELREFAGKLNVKMVVKPIVEHWKEITPFGILEGDVSLGHEIFLNNIAGRKGKCEWQWVMFRSFTEELTDESDCSFIQRTSAVNGKSYGGIMELIKAENTIRSRMEKLC